MRPKKLPQVSPIRMFLADPRKVAHVWFLRRHLKLWLIYSLLAIAAVSQLALAAHDKVIVRVKEQATAAALATFELTYKERLLENKDVLSRACTAWWFDLSHKDRRLDVPPKPSKKEKVSK